MTRHAYREGIPVGKGKTKLARRRGECGGGSESGVDKWRDASTAYN